MYTGQEQDEFGGLIYYNARWYDPEVGRFISEDPAAANPNDPLTINRYIYCRNNPLIYVDPSGEFFAEILSVFGPIGTLIGAVVDAVIVNYAINFAVNAIATEMVKNGDTRGAQVLLGIYQAYTVLQTAFVVVDLFSAIPKILDADVSVTTQSVNGAADVTKAAPNGSVPQMDIVSVTNKLFDDAGKSLSGGNQFTSDFLAGGFKGALLGGLYEEYRGGSFWEGAVNGFVMGGLIQGSRSIGLDGMGDFIDIGRQMVMGTTIYAISEGMTHNKSTGEMFRNSIIYSASLCVVSIPMVGVPLGLEYISHNSKNWW
jgi:RHS repeat-associated protein